jgi:ribosome-interacting GTPase 1
VASVGCEYTSFSTVSQGRAIMRDSVCASGMKTGRRAGIPQFNGYSVRGHHAGLTDHAVIGFPSVGKSTLMSKLT